MELFILNNVVLLDYGKNIITVILGIVEITIIQIINLNAFGKQEKKHLYIYNAIYGIILKK